MKTEALIISAGPILAPINYWRDDRSDQSLFRRARRKKNFVVKESPMRILRISSRRAVIVTARTGMIFIPHNVELVELVIARASEKERERETIFIEE